VRGETRPYYIYIYRINKCRSHECRQDLGGSLRKDIYKKGLGGWGGAVVYTEAGLMTSGCGELKMSTELFSFQTTECGSSADLKRARS
jgi:hypothetical protein